MVSHPPPRWDEWVKRVVVHVPHYLSFDGKPTAGGRQRLVRDLSAVIRDDWGREVVIAQRATTAFETTCPWGFPVIGLRCATSSRGDPRFAKLTAGLAGEGDAIIYASGEDAWPHFRPQSKGIHHGIWWDGPFSLWKRWINRRRVLAFMQSMRAVICVDTNVINWLRCQGATGLALCNKCEYIPNCADLSRIPTGKPDRGPGEPLRLVFARRFEHKRGPHLFLDALSAIRKAGLPFSATICSAQGQAGLDELSKGIESRGLADSVNVLVRDLDSVLAEYGSSDVAVVPTIWSEGTSYACVEAICAGLPVVTTPVGGLANLVLPEFNGFVVPPVAEALASAIMRFADKALWSRMRQNCLAMRPALSLERWKRQVRNWLEG